MHLSPEARLTNAMESTISSKAALFFGLRELFRPNISYRLGLLWIILDPFIIAMIYAFLIVIVRGNYQGFSIVIGVLTLQASNRAISRNVSLNLAKEPFPMMHIPTVPLLISRYSTDFFQAAFVGFAGAIVVIPLAEAPLILALHLPLVCTGLAIFGTSLGVIISPLTTLVKDMQRIISYALLASLFLLAVLYDYDSTFGAHRTILSYIPHTFGVEWVRCQINGNSYPFSLDHVILVCAIWATIFSIGVSKSGKFRWRLTTWA